MKYRFLMMCLLGGVGTWVLLPVWINFLKSIAWFQPIRADGPEYHQTKVGTPSMGGVVIWLVWILIAYGGSYAPNGMTMGLFYLSSGYFLLGLYDDLLKIYKKNSYALKPKPKFILQCVIALAGLVWMSYMGWYATIMIQRIPYLGSVVLPGWVGIPLWIIVIVGSSNAMNLVDGLDGLASGVAMSILMGLMCCNNLSSTQELNVVIGVLLGVLMGFLWYNNKPASIMMGDCGSLFIGALLGCVAFVCKLLFVYVIMSAVLIATTLSVMVQVAYFKRTGKRFFKMAPLHHHFELLGLPETSIVMRFWIVSGMFVIIGCLCQQIIS